MFLTDQLSLFDLEERAGCIRYELNNCLGPCMTNCNRVEYQSQVTEAAKFLMNGEIDIAAGIESEMLRASKRCHFEYATRLKEDLRIIRWLTKKLRSIGDLAKTNLPYIASRHGPWPMNPTGRSGISCVKVE